ncbi:MAG: c-type cytochrome [Pseudomonadota bacterium]
MFRCIAVISTLLVFGAPVYASAAKGEKLYLEYCAVCHGEKGDGNSRSRGLSPPPRDFTSIQSIVEMNKTRMTYSIAKGMPGTAMSPWESRLSKEQISSVSDYILERIIKPARVKLPGDVVGHLKAGETLYMENCSVCHGDYGETGVWTRANMSSAPRNFTAERSKTELSRSRMIEAVTFGVAGKAMMPYGSRLSQQEIGSIVDYVRVVLMRLPLEQVEQEVAQAPQQTADAPTFVNVEEHMQQPFPDGLIGNPAEGRKIYVRNCFACHGVKGDGQGSRAFFIKPKPRNFVSEDSRRALNRPRIYKAVHDGLKGSVMPAWSKVLSDQQVADVGEFVFRAFIRADLPGVSEADLEADKQKKK